MDNKDIYVKYQQNRPVLVETVYNNHGEKRARPLTTVAHLVAAYFPNTPPNELAQYTLHLPSGVARSALDEDCFAATDSTDNALDSGCTLTALGSYGSRSKKPLVIKSSVIYGDNPVSSVAVVEKQVLSLEKQLLILKEREIPGIAQNVGSSIRQNTCKFLNSAGPVDPKLNCAIPFEALPWVQELIKAVDAKQAVLLHGHWQSGKTSALRFIKSRAEGHGIKVYYLDMMASTSTLEQYLLHDYSIFKFLAWIMSGISDHLTNFSGADHFCKWSEERHEDTTAPILLIDEYDAFLKVGRKNPRLLEEMNTLISSNRNTQTTFSSIVCAGTFSIVATQTGDSSGYMDVDVDIGLRKLDSDDSLDAVVLPFDVVSPWNKTLFIETKPFECQIFKDFAADVYASHNANIEASVVDDILETTFGHPGFSIWMLSKSIQQAIGCECLTTADWMSSKRSIYNSELFKTPTMAKMLGRVKASKKIASILHILVRDNQAKCTEVRLESFLRAVGIAKPLYDNMITFTSPIIRDCLLQEFYPAYDYISELVGLFNPLSVGFLQSVLLKALSYIKAAEILDPMVTYSKGLAEAALHAELYRILHAFFRNQSVTVLTETRVVASSDMRCDIWMKTSFAEFGLELKTERDNNYMQKEAIPQIVKYASSREPREMLLLNFVRKEAASITFPIKIDPIGWDKYPKTAFSVLFVKVLGDTDSGLRFCYASNGDTCWSDL